MTVVRSRLLLVDDDDDMRRVLAVFLATTFEVIQACDGGEAIACLEAGEVSAVLTDLVMPRVDGAALVEWIVANRPALHARTFVITGGATNLRLRLFLDAFDQKRVFLKPCDPDDVVACIASAITK